MSDEFTSVQWDSEHNTTGYINPEHNHVESHTPANEEDSNSSHSNIGNISYGKENIHSSSCESDILPHLQDNNSLEGSGLITQTMILGSQSETGMFAADSIQENNDNSDDDEQSDNNASISALPEANRASVEYGTEPEQDPGLEQASKQTQKQMTASEENTRQIQEQKQEHNLEVRQEHEQSDATDDGNKSSIINSSKENKRETYNTHYTTEVTVTDPITEHDGSNSFTVYHLNISTNNPKFTKQKYTIVRRYSDFDALFKCLTFDYPSLLIPPLPNKQRLEYIKGGRFTEEFILKRCNSLNLFINRIIEHPVLSQSDVLTIFLNSNEYWNTYKLNLNFGDINSIIHHPNSSVENVTDFLMNSFKKPHVESKYNQNFKEIDHQRLKLQENLNKIDKIYSKVILKQDDISKELCSFGDEFNKLSILLNNDFDGKYRSEDELDGETKEIVQQFKAFSQNLKKSGSYYNDLNKFIEFNYLNDLKDLEHYLLSLGNLIKLKDYKVLDYEMLNNYYEKSVQEKQNLENGGSLTSTTEGTISFLSKKLESLTGLRGSSSSNGNGSDASSGHTNSSSLVNERINKLQAKIELLEKEKRIAKDVYENFEVDLLKEWSQFKRVKNEEIANSLKNLSNAYTKLYSDSFKDWNAFHCTTQGLNIENKLNSETKKDYFDNSPVLKNDKEIKDLLQSMDI